MKLRSSFRALPKNRKCSQHLPLGALLQEGDFFDRAMVFDRIIP